MKRNKLILFLLLSPMVTMMCGLGPRIEYTDPNSAECKGFRYFEYGKTWREVVCVFTCPGAQSPVQLAQQDNENTREELIEEYCTVPLIKIEENHPVPTATPTSTPAPVPDPMLTGEVTLCDTINHVLNLRIVEGYDTTQFSSLETTIDGQAMACVFNASNTTIYTCSLPASTTFPAQVTLTGDGTTLNAFSFDGSTCIFPSNPKDDNGDPPEPVDCIANPMSPQC